VYLEIESEGEKNSRMGSNCVGLFQKRSSKC